VAHSLSAKKRVRQNAKRRSANRARKDVLKDQTKLYMAAITKGDKAAAATELNKTVVVLDKMAAKHTLHKNAAARKRSRLTKRLNSLAAAK
jgi:small subunit ribosomal protein S20